MAIDKVKLKELAEFLARIWSDDPKTVVVISSGSEIPNVTRLYGYRSITHKITMPYFGTMKTVKGLRDYHKYRLWRFSLFHEACHILFNSEAVFDRVKAIISNQGVGGKLHSKKLHSNLLKFARSIANIVEDYRIEELGTRMYKGMKAERLFSRAIYSRILKVPENELEMFGELVLAGKVAGDVEVPEWIRDLVDYVKKNALDNPSETIIHAINEFAYHINIDDVIAGTWGTLDVEGIEKFTREPKKGDFSEKALEKEIEDQLDKYKDSDISQSEFDEGEEDENLMGEAEDFKDKGDLAKLAKALLKGSKEIKREFKYLTERSKDEKMIDAESVVREVKDSSKVHLEFLYDKGLSQSLIEKLKLVKKKFFEKSGRVGEEFDVESYVADRNKPFLREERTRIGGYEVVLLIDLSGSVDAFIREYKRVLLSLGDALDFLGVRFAVYGFRGDATGYRQYDHLYIPRFKGFNERWGKNVMEKIARVEAKGLTPTGTILYELYPVVKKLKNPIVILLTDGYPEPYYEELRARDMIKKYVRSGIELIGIAIASNPEAVAKFSSNLKERLGIRKSIGISMYDLKLLPMKLLRLLMEVSM
ncbi:hypothetical protein DRN93_01300 [archaeon]|nr:MAG: hypothetical protein DRN93_01300 [archaeon]